MFAREIKTPKTRTRTTLMHVSVAINENKLLHLYLSKGNFSNHFLVQGNEHRF